VGADEGEEWERQAVRAKGRLKVEREVSPEPAPDGAHRVTAGPPIGLAQAGGQILNGIDGRPDGALLGERRDGGGEGRHVLPESASLKHTGAGGDRGLLRSSQGA
jgi:hypothetical protein